MNQPGTLSLAPGLSQNQDTGPLEKPLVLYPPAHSLETGPAAVVDPDIKTYDILLRNIRLPP